jgi:hypothetical protein
MKLAFEKTDRGFTIKAYWGDCADAEVEITRDGNTFKKFTYPSYKIFNLEAHFGDIVDGFLSSDELSGFRVAGSAGLGGVVMPQTQAPDGKEKP